MVPTFYARTHTHTKLDNLFYIFVFNSSTEHIQHSESIIMQLELLCCSLNKFEIDKVFFWVHKSLVIELMQGMEVFLCDFKFTIKSHLEEIQVIKWNSTPMAKIIKSQKKSISTSYMVIKHCIIALRWWWWCLV